MTQLLTHPQARDQILDFCREGFLGQAKLDGVRLALVYGGDECQPVYALTKTGMKVEAPALGLPAMAPGTVIDGELLGEGSWQSAQSSLRKILLGERLTLPCSWMAFDIIVDPLGVTEQPGFEHRVRFLQQRGFPVVPTGEVEAMWQLVTDEGLEGVVVRKRDALPGDPSWKIKAPQQMNVIVMGGKGMVLRDGRPHVVCSLNEPNGTYRIACEGKTTNGKVRAARVIGPAVGQNVSYDQLGSIRE